MILANVVATASLVWRLLRVAEAGSWVCASVTALIRSLMRGVTLSWVAVPELVNDSVVAEKADQRTVNNEHGVFDDSRTTGTYGSEA